MKTLKIAALALALLAFAGQATAQSVDIEAGDDSQVDVDVDASQHTVINNITVVVGGGQFQPRMPIPAPIFANYCVRAFLGHPAYAYSFVPMGQLYIGATCIIGFDNFGQPAYGQGVLQ